MIKSLIVTNFLNESLEINLARPDISGLVVKNITGLEPPKATINTTSLSSGDGSKYNSARLGNRNIVLTLMFSDWSIESIEDIRYKIYKYFPIKRELSIEVITDKRKAKIKGFVETNEVVIFESREYTTISLICPDPYFYSSGVNGIQKTLFSGVKSVFEFPFENNSIVENLIELGEIQNKVEEVIVYTGDAPIGMLIKIHAIGDAGNITIYNVNNLETMVIDTTKLARLTGFGIVAGDDICISTIKGEKGITLLRDGIYTNILNCMDKHSKWFELTKGDNIFAYDATTGSNNLQFEIQNKIAYEGM